MIRQCYTYAHIETLRPARLSGKVREVNFVVDSDCDFIWQSTAIMFDYDLTVKFELPSGAASAYPIRASNLGTAQHPMHLVSEIRVPGGSRIRVTLNNSLSTGRKWNHVRLGLFGEKEFPNAR